MSRVQKILTGLLLAVCALVVFFLGLVDLTPYLRPESAPSPGDVQADSQPATESSNPPAGQGPSPVQEEPPPALESPEPREAAPEAGEKVVPLAAGEEAPAVTGEKTTPAEAASAPEAEGEEPSLSEKEDVEAQEEGAASSKEADQGEVEKEKLEAAQEEVPTPSAAEESTAALRLDAGGSAYPFSVLLASFKVQDRAEQALEIYRRRGIDAYWVRVELEEKGTWFRVFTGHFRSRGAAEAFVEKKEIQEARVKSTRFASLVGVFQPGEPADALKGQLHSLGYCPYVISEPDGLHRLYAGAFYTEEGAAGLCAELQDRGVQCRPVQR